MRLSMKIYLIMLVLVAVALGIVAIGFYSIRSLSGVIIDSNEAASRASLLAAMNQQMMRRVVATKDILISNSDAVMKQIHDEVFPDSDAKLRKAVEEYAVHLPANADSEMRGRSAQILAKWEEFTGVTKAAADLSLKNTNNRAREIFRAQEKMWDDIFAELTTVRNILDASDSAKMKALLPNLIDMREDLTYFQLLTMKMIDEPDQGKLHDMDKNIMRLIGEADKNIQMLINELPAREAETMKKVFIQLQDRVAKKDYAAFLPLVLEDSNGMAIRLYQSKGTVAQKALDDYITGLMNSAADYQDKLEEDSQTTAAFIQWTMLAGSLAGLAIGAFLAVITIRGINATLTRIISGLGESSSQVHSAANQISGASQNLAEGATEQAASLEETSSALEQMASMTRQNADNATKTNDTNQNNNKLISEGSSAVRNMSAAMGEINDSAEKISRIIKTIEDIAFQTNLLALNAAVEAARAGESGKGFAVVADEVRNLAQRSAQAARDTTELIHGTVDRVKNGSEIASALETSFKEIEEGSSLVSRLMAEITSATNEQAQGVDQVNTAVAQMDKVTQQNAANAEETASASEELSAQAASLNDMVGELVKLVRGAGNGLPAAEERPAAAQPRSAGKPPRNTIPPARALPPPTSKSSPKVMKPEEIIPLSGDDFNDF